MAIWVFALGNWKGGPGKTTISASLASWVSSLNIPVAGIDCDPLGGFAMWAAKRRAVAGIEKFKDKIRPIEVTHLEASEADNESIAAMRDRDALVNEINRLDAAGYKAVVVDLPGVNSHFTNEAHMLADVVASPIDMQDAGAFDMLQGGYGDSVSYWRGRMQEKNDLPPFAWYCIPNKVYVTSDRGVMLPYHRERIVKLEALSNKMDFIVTPPLYNEPGHAPALERGVTVIDADPDWLQNEVGRFDQDQAKKVLEAAFGRVMAPAFVRGRAA